MSHLLLTDVATEVLVENISAYEDLDPTDREEFEEMDKRLLALKFMFTDILRQVGRDVSEQTELETLARKKNPYYVAIFTSDGRIP
jgi:hypothetical protein